MNVSSNLRIGYVPYELFHSYWAICQQGIKIRASELGITLVTPNTNVDANYEDAIAEVFAQNVDAIILPGNLVIHVADSPLITEARTPIVVAEYSSRPPFACAVRTNEVQGADAIVRYLAEQLGNRGKIAQFGGGLTPRYNALYYLKKEHPDICIAYETQGIWSRADGARMMSDALAAHPDIRGVFAHNDELALGALDVLEQRGLCGSVVVVGFDGTPDGLAAVHRGRLAATVYRSTFAVGRKCLEMAALIAQGETVPAEVQTDVQLITAANVTDAALDSMELLPRILQDLLASNQAQLQLQERIISSQRAVIQELSTPIIPISERILVLPLIGAIDSIRAQQIIKTMLKAINERRAAALIIDITGVQIIDQSVAQYLLQAARAAQLLGTRVILVGISPEIAQTLVQMGIDLSSLPTYSTLQFGLAYANTYVH